MTKKSLLVGGRQIGLIAISCALLVVAVLQQPTPVHSITKKRPQRQHQQHRAATPPVTPQPATPLATITTLPSPSTFGDCSAGNILNVVAHEDDDILFINPTIQDAADAGACIATVYATSGDSGDPMRYWRQRETGVEAAYAAMVHVQNIWTTETVTVHGNPIRLRRLDGDHRVSLLFMRLPDGNTDGSGFNATHHQSLLKLRNGEIPSIGTVDGTARYSREELLASLQSIITAIAPRAINTLAYGPEVTSADHADHQVIGYLTVTAAKNISFTGSIQTFYGYQLNQMPVNVSPQQTVEKRQVFNTYVRHDSNICSTATDCFNDQVYQKFFSRQYVASHL